MGKWNAIRLSNKDDLGLVNNIPLFKLSRNALAYACNIVMSGL